jgi:glutamine---fructose-6-phosphate transaminase (isomerizing)
MTGSRIWSDILQQPLALREILAHQFGPGKGDLEEAARRIRNASRLLISGMGASLFAALPLSVMLGRQGRWAPIVETSELLHHQRALCKGAVLVLVSRSGETIETTRLLQAGVEPAAVIGVTAVEASTLYRQADIGVRAAARQDGLVAVQTYSGTLLTLLLLGAAVLGELDRGWREDAESAIQAVETFLQEKDAWGHAWESFLGEAASLYLLGRGAAMATALEGALLFQETAKMSVVGMNAAAFRHGPVEVTGKDFRAVLFASQEPTRRLDESLAEELTGFGAGVCLIGPGKRPESSLLLDLQLPQVPDFLAPLVEIAPMQIAACRTAVRKGQTLDEFRFATPVTRDEARFR